MSHILDSSSSNSCDVLEENGIMTTLVGARGGVREQAINLGVIPRKDVPTFTIYRYVPWINWTALSSTSEGVGDFIGSVYIEGTTSFQVVNNTDSILYITGGIPERTSIINGPEVVIGPFKASNITLSSSSVTILARCYGYDFTSTRKTRGFLDPRGPSAYVEIRGLKPGENPSQPLLRSSWIRTYDLFDLILGNALPAPQVTNTSWFSNALDFSGAISCYLNLVATASALPNNSTNLIAYLSYTGIATAMGNWNAGGTNLVSVVGPNYITNAPITLAANKPQLELLFPTGDTNSCQITYIDMWVAGEVTA